MNYLILLYGAVGLVFWRMVFWRILCMGFRSIILNKLLPGWKNRRTREKNQTELDLQLGLRRAVLRQFVCPFERDEACCYRSNARLCPFSHIGPEAIELQLQMGLEVPHALAEVPAYLCVRHLMNPNSCQYSRNAHAQNSDQQNILAFCTNGLHLRIEQMINLEYYELMNRENIRLFLGRDANRQCGLCFERVLSKRLLTNRQFAILENCAHCFCAQCIAEWRSTGEYACPVCATISTRVVYRKRFTDSPEHKRSLFAAQWWWFYPNI